MDNTVKCEFCGRKFIGRMPHKCVGGFRKRKIKWVFLTSQEVENCTLDLQDKQHA